MNESYPGVDGAQQAAGCHEKYTGHLHHAETAPGKKWYYPTTGNQKQRQKKRIHTLLLNSARSAEGPPFGLDRAEFLMKSAATATVRFRTNSDGQAAPLFQETNKVNC